MQIKLYVVIARDCVDYDYGAILYYQEYHKVFIYIGSDQTKNNRNQLPHILKYRKCYGNQF